MYKYGPVTKSKLSYTLRQTLPQRGLQRGGEPRGTARPHIGRRPPDDQLTTVNADSEVSETQPGGRLIHRAADVDYITDATGRIGITSYRPAKFVPNLR